MREEVGSDGRTYQLINNEWVPKDKGQSAASVGEAALSLGSSMALEPVAGLAGLLGSALPGEAGQGADFVQAVRDQAYQPRNDESIQALGGALQPIMNAYSSGMNPAEQAVTDTLGGGAGAAFRVLPEMLASVAGVGAVASGGRALARVPGLAANAIGPMATRAGTALEGTLTSAADALDVASGGRMVNRVTDRMDITGGPPLPPGAGGTDRALQGFLTLDEAAQTGLPLTYGDELALTARNSDELAHSQRVRNAEELKRTDPVTGGLVERTREAQKDWATQQVKQRLGIEGGMQLTDDVLGQKLNELGGEFDKFADDIGSVTLGDVAIQLDDIAEQATGTHGGQIQKIAEDAKKMASQNDGALTGQDWQLLRTRLGKMVEAGGRQGDAAKIGDAVEMQNILIDLMESNLPQASKEAMQVTRSQYGLAKTLLKRTGNLSADGRVNSRSLYGSLKTAGKIRSRADDSLLRMLETDRFLTDRITPSSGTAERLLANPGRVAITGGIGLAGAGAIGGGANLLFGD
tara:strand:+ start:662 stop:2227 length:1566 start_codon:yes stop_codon:yes gene_type:complete